MSREGGEVREETEAEYEARHRPAPLTPIAVERERRAEIARVEAAARWDRGIREHGLAPLMEQVQRRLDELPAFLADLARRRALLPRVVALHQDCLDLGLSRDLRLRIEALHRQIQGEPTLVANAIPARKLLDDIKCYGDFYREPDENGIVPADHGGLYREWRRMLGWYVAPLPEPSADDCARQVEQLEAQVLRAIKGRR
jgi:hypothetical protein